MNRTQQQVKGRIVTVTAALALVGFFLEITPVGGAFALALTGVALEVPGLGFLAYLSLAAAAAVGIHLGATEPTPKDPPAPETPPLPQGGDGEAVGEQVRVRPELHQMHMLFTALGGYVLLKAFSLALMTPAAQRLGVTAADLSAAFAFGLYFVTVGAFLLWEFLRWIAHQQRWERLQAELIGGSVTWMVALVLLIKPILYIGTHLHAGELLTGPRSALVLLLHLTLVALAYVVWRARPQSLRATLIGLASLGGVIVLCTILLLLVERQLTG
jgi:hypothetical protein